MSQDLIRIIDSICRDKNIDRDEFITDLQGAMASAIRKTYDTEEADVKLDPLTGQITANAEGHNLDIQALGRIAAQTAKQVIIQKTRERERTSIFGEFTERRGTIVTGAVVRAERGNLLVNIGRTEGFLPRSEQIPGETHQVGERIRVLILEVREQPSQVKVILSRSHPEFIVRLFELEVPEVAERIIEIKALARESGYRTKVAVASIDSKVDAVGACVGVRGSRIKNIVDELGGEKIDIVRWNESSQILIQNALKPAEVEETALGLELGKATVVVAEDQLSLAIGKRGQNVRLAARLTGWDIDILTPAEHTKNLETLERVLKSVPGVDDVLVDKIIAMGCVSVYDLDEIGPEPVVENLELDPDLAEKIVVEAGEEVIRLEEAKEAAAKAKAEAVAAGIVETPASEPVESAFVEGESASSPDEAATIESAAGDTTEQGPQDATATDDVSGAVETVGAVAGDGESSAELAAETAFTPDAPADIGDQGETHTPAEPTDMAATAPADTRPVATDTESEEKPPEPAG